MTQKSLKQFRILVMFPLAEPHQDPSQQITVGAFDPNDAKRRVVDMLRSENKKDFDFIEIQEIGRP